MDRTYTRQSRPLVNQQTTSICALLQIDDPLVLLNAYSNPNDSVSVAETTDNSLKDTSLTYTSFNVSNSTPTKLILPKPKFDESNDSILEENNKSLVLAESASTTDVENLETVEAPLIKKFKRRNASIYVSNLDDV